jgi:zinc transporter ZupT
MSTEIVISYFSNGLSWLAYVHLAGDLMAACFCIGLAVAIHWARKRMEVTLPRADQWILYSFKAFFVLKGIGSGLDFGLILWPGSPAWIVVETLLKFGMSLAAGLTFALVVKELPRLRSAHADIYMRRLAAELWKGRKSTPPAG